MSLIVRFLGLAIAAAAALPAPLGARSSVGSAPGEVRIPMRVARQWVTLPRSPRSAVLVARAVDPEGHAYVAWRDSMGWNPTDLQREFRLPKTEYLLGEPIVLEMHVALDGPGVWREWCGVRHMGSRVLLRAADGAWVADPRESEQHVTVFGGGLSSAREVKRDDPWSDWIAVQKWAAVERPGAYDLFVVRFGAMGDVVGYRRAKRVAIAARFGTPWHLEPDGSLRDRLGNVRASKVILRWDYFGRLRASPLLAKLPPELRDKLGNSAANVQDFAQFHITIRDGTPEEVAAMVEEATRLAEGTPDKPCPCGRATATREAIWHTRQACFLPLISNWMHDPRRTLYLDALARNPSPGAWALLLDDPELAQLPIRVIDGTHVRRAIQRLISRLEDRSPAVRAVAEERLRFLTRNAISRLADPADDVDGRATHEAWQRWWDANASNFAFRPRLPGDFGIH